RCARARARLRRAGVRRPPRHHLSPHPRERAAGGGRVVSLATEARRVLEGLPPTAREALQSSAAFVPPGWLYGATLRRTRAMLARSERMPADELKRHTDARVRDLVAYAHARVPYYRDVMDERGVRPEHVRGLADLRLLPFLTKDILRREFA